MAAAAACNENGPMIGPALARGGAQSIASVRPIDDGHDGHNAKRILAALLMMHPAHCWRGVNPSSRMTPFSGLAPNSIGHVASREAQRRKEGHFSAADAHFQIMSKIWCCLPPSGQKPIRTPPIPGKQAKHAHCGCASGLGSAMWAKLTGEGGQLHPGCIPTHFRGSSIFSLPNLNLQRSSFVCGGGGGGRRRPSNISRRN